MTLPTFMNAFSYWFAIGAALLPLGIASYSLIGEIVQKSLELRLATLACLLSVGFNLMISSRVNDVRTAQ
jgi:hypothetical protein